MIDSLHMKTSDMDQGVMFFSLSSREKDEVGYPVTGVETIELCGRHLNGSLSERASPCGLLLGGMTPSPSGDQVTTTCPMCHGILGLENPWSPVHENQQVGIEREPPKEKKASFGRLAATLMGSVISFLYGSELGSLQGSKDHRGSHGCLS
jgi:hypothetical protein